MMRELFAWAWTRWKLAAQAIGNFQARVLLSVCYFLVISPFALIVKVLNDPLRLRTSKSGSFWVERGGSESFSEAARRQF